MRTLFKILLGLAGFIVVLAGIAGAVLAYLEYPGGMSPSYRAADHDRRLTAVAHEAAPLIASINRFYAAHGHCPLISTGNLAEFRGGTGFDAVIRGNNIDFHKPDAMVGWSYSTSEPAAADCSLWRNLGWDPALIWSRGREQAHWVFVPGDGRDEIEIKLDAGG
jgi:hypothetical protein